MTGLVKNEKKRINVLVKIKKFEYDADSDAIRVLGTNARMNKYIALGAYQSLDIKAPLTVTLIKHNFDAIHVRRLREAVAE